MYAVSCRVLAMSLPISDTAGRVVSETYGNSNATSGATESDSTPQRESCAMGPPQDTFWARPAVTAHAVCHRLQTKLGKYRIRRLVASGVRSL